MAMFRYMQGAVICHDHPASRLSRTFRSVHISCAVFASVSEISESTGSTKRISIRAFASDLLLRTGLRFSKANGVLRPFRRVRYVGSACQWNVMSRVLRCTSPCVSLYELLVCKTFRRGYRGCYCLTWLIRRVSMRMMMMIMMLVSGVIGRLCSAGELKICQYVQEREYKKIMTYSHSFQIVI